VYYASLNTLAHIPRWDISFISATSSSVAGEILHVTIRDRLLIMSTKSGFVVPEGQSPPFAVVTDDDHIAWILVASALGLACFLFFAMIRILVRTTLTNGFGIDDYMLFTATILAVIQSTIVLAASAKGLGKTIDLIPTSAQQTVQEMYYTSNFFMLLSLGLAKISVVCFLHRISRMKQHRIVFNVAMGVIAACTAGSIFAVALQCDLNHPWFSVGENCTGIVSILAGRCDAI
jgi:hypothetical protein